MKKRDSNLIWRGAGGICKILGHAVRFCTVPLKERFLDIFGKRVLERTYIGHGDMLECRGWDFRGRFFPYNDVEYKEYLEKLKEPRG